MELKAAEQRWLKERVGGAKEDLRRLRRRMCVSRIYQLRMHHCPWGMSMQRQILISESPVFKKLEVVKAAHDSQLVVAAPAER